MSISVTYRLDLTQEELNLIGLALCGKLKPEQNTTAHELNNHILKQRKAVHTQHVELSERALNSLKTRPN